MIKHKICLDCGKDISGTHIIKVRCMDCQRVYRNECRKKWSERPEHKKKILNHLKDYYNQPEVKNKRKVYMKNYRQRKETKERKNETKNA